MSREDVVPKTWITGYVLVPPADASEPLGYLELRGIKFDTVVHGRVVTLRGMLIALVPIVALIIGLLLWALASNTIVKDAGKIMFFCGVLVALFVAAKQTVHIP